MVQEIIGVALIGLFYFCVIIVLFAPTLYAAWIYLISKKVRLKTKGLLKTALTTFCINLILGYFLVHLAFDYFLPSAVAEKNALVVKTLETAVTSQQAFYKVHGRYYSVGPVRGPFTDDQGLAVEKDVILEVVPRWDRSGGNETFQAYAMHVWGRDLITSDTAGKVTQPAQDSPEAAGIRAKMLNSVK